MTAQHVFDRQLLHFPWSFMLTIWVWFALYALRRVIRKDMLPRYFKWLRWFVSHSYLGLYVEAAVIVVVCAFLREPSDVGNGDPAWKSYVDAFVGWTPGAVAACYLMYRKWFYVLTWTS